MIYPLYMVNVQAPHFCTYILYVNPIIWTLNPVLPEIPILRLPSGCCGSGRSRGSSSRSTWGIHNPPTWGNPPPPPPQDWGRHSERLLERLLLSPPKQRYPTLPTEIRKWPSLIFMNWKMSSPVCFTFGQPWNKIELFILPSFPPCMFQWSVAPLSKSDRVDQSFPAGSGQAQNQPGFSPPQPQHRGEKTGEGGQERWPHGEMTSWRDDILERWPHGEMTS